MLFPTTRVLARTAGAAALLVGTLGVTGIADAPAATALSAPSEVTSTRGGACTYEAVSPGPDVTDQIVTKLAAASGRHDVKSPLGKWQGRVYFGPGWYGSKPITMPDDVHIELAPGATLRPLEPDGGAPPKGDWGFLLFGTEGDPTTNVTLTAGNGCGGPGAPTSANKPTNTDFRDNPLYGEMAAAPVPYGAWPTDTMWVMDLDPAGDPSMDGDEIGVQVTGFFIRNAENIWISRLFTIQNAARQLDEIGPVDGVTSRTTAVMIDSYDYPTAEQVPTNINVSWHYNIVAPSGQGPNQIRTCVDCTFSHIFGHGGAALRVETDGVAGACDGLAGPAKVDGLRADHIQGVYGNYAVILNPHCVDNGDVRVNTVWSTSEYGMVGIAAGDKDHPGRGSFADETVVANVLGCGSVPPALTAQKAYPQKDSYLPSKSALAVAFADVGWANGAGEYAWPAPGLPGFPIDQVPLGATYHQITSSECP